MNLKLHSIVFRTGVVKQFLLFVLSAALLSACGFQLRGAYTLPEAMQSTYIEHQVSADLIRSLKISLKASDVNVSETKSTDAAILKLFNEQKSKRTVSVDAKGRAREYTLSYSLGFSLSSAQNKSIIPEQSILIERDFLFDPEEIGRAHV